MFKLIKGLLAGDDAREIKNLMRIVEQVNALEPEFEKLNTDSLAAKTGEFRERLRRGETLDSLLPEAYALVREGAKRTLGQRHFDGAELGGVVAEIDKLFEGRYSALTSSLDLGRPPRGQGGSAGHGGGRRPRHLH